MTKGVVLSLYDYTGEALRPWAEAGYTCYAYDIQHDNSTRWDFKGGGSVQFIHADLHNIETIYALRTMFKNERLVFAMGFPVCTDLAVSGARHFKAKAEKDPDFQRKAAMYARWCGELFDVLGVPYFIENPVSKLSTLWRKPDYTFHPWHYGGYIPDGQASHPKWPEYIAPRDAYPKLTCLWTGGGFVMPSARPVTVESFLSRQYKKLGGKSMKTKNIRSATPRGFARAVFEANQKEHANV